MKEMFFEAMQTYLAPLFCLTIFAVMVVRDCLLSRRTKQLFMMEILVIFIMIATTWIDRTVSVFSDDIYSCIRIITTSINFAVSPASPYFIMMIYEHRSSRKNGILAAIPLVANIAICFASIKTGWVFSVNSQNDYSRGMLFFVPFLLSAVYLVMMTVLSARQINKPNRQAETILLLTISAVVAVATTLEIIFVKRFMLWSTTAGCVILYYLLLSVQTVLYDPLTSTYSRAALERFVERARPGEYTLAMIDINGLKQFNDHHGHLAGDSAIINVSSTILSHIGRKAHLYRYGGDEFLLIAPKITPEKLKRMLYHAQIDCENVDGIPVSFAFGLSVRKADEPFQAAIMAADAQMYENKNFPGQALPI